MLAGPNFCSCPVLIAGGQVPAHILVEGHLVVPIRTL